MKSSLATAFELVAGPYSFTEGPVWDGARVIFTDMHASRILAHDPHTSTTEVILTDTEVTNGLALDVAGNLYGCQDRGRRVVRYERDGARVVVADSYGGRRLNSPNDLVVDSGGRVWFSDPRYGEHRADMELDHESVYCAVPEAGGYRVRRVTFDTIRPNGVLLSSDEATLYVAESPRAPAGRRDLRAYTVLDDATLADPEVLHDFGDHRGVDGMTIGPNECIVATCGWSKSGPGPRLAVFAPSGALLTEIPTPADPTNVCIGGPTGDDLYLTAFDGCLWRLPDFHTKLSS